MARVEPWIKVRESLHSDVKVDRVADAMGINTDEAVGLLIRFWLWVTAHAEDRYGSVTGVTPDVTDKRYGDGFAAVMVEVGWALFDPHLIIPRFDLHLSQSAKQRALTAARVNKHREGKRLEGCNADVTQERYSCNAGALPEGRGGEKRQQQSRYAAAAVRLNEYGISSPTAERLADDHELTPAIVDAILGECTDRQGPGLRVNLIREHAAATARELAERAARAEAGKKSDRKATQSRMNAASRILRQFTDRPPPEQLTAAERRLFAVLDDHAGRGVEITEDALRCLLLDRDGNVTATGVNRLDVDLAEIETRETA